MVGGYGAPKLAFAPLFILWFGIGIESKIALVASVVFFIVYFSTLAGVRALDAQARADGADRGRERAPGRAPHRLSRRGAAYLRRLPHRGALRDRRRGHRRADLVQPRARLSGADRRDEFRHHQRCSPRSSPRRSSSMPPTGCSTPPSGRCCAGGRRRRPCWTSGPEHARPPLLEIRSLGKRFPARQGREPSPWVIQDLSFSVARGRIPDHHRPLGRRQVDAAQHDRADRHRERRRDRVRRRERDIRTMPRALRPGFDRRIGYVTQDDNLLPWRTTIDNVLFPIEVQGRLNDETRAQADDARSAPSGSPASSATIRTSCPAACASARRSSARSSTIRRSS